MALPILSSFKLDYGNGMCSINPIGRYFGLEIHFRGIPSILPTLDESWNYKFIKNILLITATDIVKPPTLIFEYEGVLDIKLSIGMDWYKNKIIGKVNNNTISYWELENSDYVSGTYWASYSGDYLIGKPVKTKEIRKRLTEKEKENIKIKAQWEGRVPLDPSQSQSSESEGGGGGSGGY